MKRTLAISSLFVGTAILVACGGSSNPPVAVSSNAEAGAPPPTDAGIGTSAPPPPVQDAGGPVMPTFFTDAGAPPPAAMTDQAADLAIDVLLGTASAKSAPKMTEVSGAVGRQTMKEGDHLVLMVNLEPNKCYTIIGSSLPGMVTDLEVKLLGPPFYNVEAGKSDAKDKVLPVVAGGAKALCPISPIALPYKVDAIANKGAGRVGVKVYARAK